MLLFLYNLWKILRSRITNLYVLFVWLYAICARGHINLITSDRKKKKTFSSVSGLLRVAFKRVKFVAVKGIDN